MSRRRRSQIRWRAWGSRPVVGSSSSSSCGSVSYTHLDVYKRQVLATAQTDAEIEQFLRTYADTIYHPVGTCRMGPTAMDVVDAQLRVHGMQGLRVVDASIMPRIVSGNTNAPTGMIAEKAVDLLRAAP